MKVNVSGLVFLSQLFESVVTASFCRDVIYCMQCPLNI